MEVIHKTQFAQFEKDFTKLPVFLQKKFEEAVITNAKKFDAERVTNKLQKAEKKLNEQKQQQEMKRLQKRQNYEEILQRGRQAKITQNEYLCQVMTHKQKTADEIYAEQLDIKINKAQSLGAKKVQEAKTVRAQEDERKLKRQKNEKLVMSYPNVRVESVKAEKKNKLVYKHYSILKNIHTRQFHSERETRKKKEELENKLAKAESRKQQILNEVVAKAIKAASKKDYGTKIVETLEEKLLRKQNKAEENRKLIIQSKIDKASQSYNRLSTQSNSDSSLVRENDNENLKVAQSELKACYSIITAQKEANFKMLEEMNELKKQMQNLQKETSYNTKKPIAFTIGETMMDKKFCNFDPVNQENEKRNTEQQSWTMI